MSNFFEGAALGVAAVSLTLLPLGAHAAEGEGWDWVVAPYLWGVTVGTDIQTGPLSVGSETEFSDIIDKLDGAFQLHLEGQGDHFGVLADFTFLSVADEQDHSFSHTESDLDTWLIEAAALWSTGDERYTGLDLLAGFRYIDVDLTVRVDPANALLPTSTVQDDNSFADVMVGVRYTWALADRWALMLRADASFGDTEGAWNATAIAQYRTNNGGWLLGYRHLSIEIESGELNTDISMSGPQIGYAFSF